MSNKYPQQLDSYENAVIERFRSHPVLARMEKIPNQGLEDILLQKCFLSGAFKNFYRRALQHIQDPQAKEVAGTVLEEEYRPEDHEWLLVRDLLRMGISEKKIYGNAPTPTTTEAVKRLLELVSPKESDYDLTAVVALRIAGEVLPGIEYNMICPELEKRGLLTENESVFYWPHMRHDKKEKPIDEGGSSHTDRFSPILSRLVETEQDLAIAKAEMDKALMARSGFYDQFLKYVEFWDEDYFLQFVQDW